MFQNTDGTLERQSGIRPGSIGDSMAETSRMVNLIDHINYSDMIEMMEFTTILMNFRTATGYIRHPAAPICDDKGHSWRETDTPTDQCLPWYLAMPHMPDKEEMRERIKANYFRTGNNNFVSPVFFAVLVESKLLTSIFCYLQILIFDCPFRWSDALKKFEKSDNASADYLNWFHASLTAYDWARFHMPKDRFMKKVRGYYANEPNSEWIVNLYQMAADKYLK
jgi:hypothetical protein